MDNSRIMVSSNWSHIGGCTFSQSFQERAADQDIFIKPNINELVDEKKSILLSKEQSSEFCEMHIKIYPLYKIQAVSLVCNAAKVEVFQGAIKEYLETIYGAVVDETDEFKSYRYDIEIEKSGITDITLRFLTDTSDVCIFGLMLYTCPNPNGITTLLPFNGDLNIQNILQNTRTRNAVHNKCEKLFEHVTKSNKYSTSALNEPENQQINIAKHGSIDAAIKTSEDMFCTLQSHIDKRLNEFEMRMQTRLKEMEEHQNRKLVKTHIDERLNEFEMRMQTLLKEMEVRQNRKLDKILSILENSNQ